MKVRSLAAHCSSYFSDTSLVGTTGIGPVFPVLGGRLSDGTTATNLIWRMLRS
jgi:hypothetical protein